MKKILTADFAQIEARVLAWLAGQSDLLKLFADDGPIYEVMAAKIYGKPINKKEHPKERQLGKETILGGGFGMGHKKFRAQCKKKGIMITPELAEQTIKTYRAANDKIVKLWYAAENAAVEAVEHPGKITTCAAGRIKYRMAGSFLWCQLPSGRCLCYPYPKLVEIQKPWGEMGWALRYKGVNSYTRKWEDIDTYGGKLVENFVQAVARDLMAEAMLRVESAEYPVVLTVHDELVSEVEAEKADVPAFEELMAVVPAWAAGCPVKAEGWAGERYRK